MTSLMHLIAPSPRPRPRSAGRRHPAPLAAPLVCALAVVLLLSLAASAAAYTTSTQFTITGRGWGHGIGMSQYGAYGYANHGWKYKDILKHYYTGIGFGTVANDNIRVRLRSGLSSVKVTCDNAYRAWTTGVRFDIPAGTTATTTYVDGKYHVVAGDSSKDFTSPVTFTPDSGHLKTVTATDLGTTGTYRGVIRVIRYDSALMMVNKLPLESYLYGVVPSEMPYSWPAEALKAQACAARAYAQRSRNASDSWDVYCTTRDQVYRGKSGEHSESNAAIKATAGIVPTYNGAVISAFFFSTSGGHTENIENSWQTSAVPYLKGVSDPYDTASPYHIWPSPIRESAGTVGSDLGSTFVQGTLRGVYVVKRGVSPRIVKAAVIGTSGVTFIHGSILRAKLGLRDSWAYFKSMSISPAPADKPSITAGELLELKGRIYPALASGTTVTLHYYNNGAWHSRSVATTRHTQDLGSGYTAKYSTYTTSVSPSQTTQYYFSSGKAKTATVTVTVTAAKSAARSAAQSAATPTPWPTPTLTDTATPSPAATLQETPQPDGRD